MRRASLVSTWQSSARVAKRFLDQNGRALRCLHVSLWAWRAAIFRSGLAALFCSMTIGGCLVSASVLPFLPNKMGVARELYRVLLRMTAFGWTARVDGTADISTKPPDSHCTCTGASCLLRTNSPTATAALQVAVRTFSIGPALSITQPGTSPTRDEFAAHLAPFADIEMRKRRINLSRRERKFDLAVGDFRGRAPAIR